jgi:hypothetical protein
LDALREAGKPVKQGIKVRLRLPRGGGVREVEMPAEFRDRKGRVAYGQMDPADLTTPDKFHDRLRAAYQQKSRFLVVTQDGEATGADPRTARLIKVAQRYERLKEARLKRLAGERAAAKRAGNRQPIADLDRQIRELKNNQFGVRVANGPAWARIQENATNGRNWEEAVRAACDQHARMNLSPKGRTAVQIHNDRPAVKVRGQIVGIEPDLELRHADGRLRAVGEVKSGGHYDAAQLRAHLKYAHQQGVPYLLITPNGKKPPMDKQTKRVSRVPERYKRMKAAKIKTLKSERSAALRDGDIAKAAVLRKQIITLKANKFGMVVVRGDKLIQTLYKGSHNSPAKPSAGGTASQPSASGTASAGPKPSAGGTASGPKPGFQCGGIFGGHH